MTETKGVNNLPYISKGIFLGDSFYDTYLSNKLLLGNKGIGSHKITISSSEIKAPPL